MAWKPKEKQLTPEETISLAKQELAPFWTGSEPLIGAVRGDNRQVSVHPLDPSFEKRSWLMLFVDLTTFAGDTVLQTAREWHKRYGSLGIDFMLIVRPSYRFMDKAKAVLPLLHKNGLGFPVVLDQDNLLSDGFRVTALPKVQLLHQRKIAFERSGPAWHEGLEVEIQKFLRSKDPGLPLALPIELEAGIRVDQGRVELGKGTLPSGLKLTGKWDIHPDHIVTHDSAASIRSRCPTPRVSVIAQVAPIVDGFSRMRVELNGNPVFDAAAGPDLSFSDDGGSEVRIGEARLYHLLAGLPDRAREVTFSFPDAERLGVSLFGLRFGT